MGASGGWVRWGASVWFLVALTVAVGLVGALAGGCAGDDTATTGGPGSTSATTLPLSTTTSASTADPTTAAPTTAAPTTGPPTESTVPGRGQTEAGVLSPSTGVFSTCRDCHSYLDPPHRPRPALNPTFRHEKHVQRGTRCDACHRLPVHQTSGIRRPGMAECYTCHNTTSSATAPSDCSLCHPPGFETTPSSHTTQFFAGGHAEVVAVQGTAECLTCHPGDETTFCRGCHGLDMPHPPGWALALGGGPGAHVNAAHADPGVCVKCHDNQVDAAPPAPSAGCYGGECHGS